MPITTSKSDCIVFALDDYNHNLYAIEQDTYAKSWDWCDWNSSSEPTLINKPTFDLNPTLGLTVVKQNLMERRKAGLVSLILMIENINVIAVDKTMSY